MKKYLINNHSDSLIIFFTGWGCDEFEFSHLQSNSDILLLYDYSDLNLDFDFSKYKKYNLIAFSAGVFISSIINFDFKIDNKIAISGNPFLFDERLGMSKEIQDVLCNITDKNADEFARNYLVKTDEEWEKFHHSKRTLESCREEFNKLKEFYTKKYQNIKDIFDFALIGESDQIFSLPVQKKFYGKRLYIIKNARHNLFYRYTSYEQIFNLIHITM